MDVRDSMISLFVPEADLEELHSINTPKVFNKIESLDGNSPVISSARRGHTSFSQILPI